MEMRKRFAIIGAGISGMSAAHMLKDSFDITLYEKDEKPGGLIKCNRVNGSLFHLCGGHVFNSKRQDVLEWFWNKFNKEEEFSKTDRNSVVFLEDGKEIPYPIENHVYLLDPVTQKRFIDDLVLIANKDSFEPENFEEFLKNRFGITLYELYFKPYNEKVWRRNLINVPLTWLEGKLPMPSVAEMIYNNMNHVKEKSFVHSTFWYENDNGSQYIADRLADGLNIKYNINVTTIEKSKAKWIINGEEYDHVIYCGNIKDMIRVLKGIDIQNFYDDIESLEYHGTTSVFCEIDKNPYTWIYLPSKLHQSHRIICTGNFASSNNYNLPTNRITATIEFTDEMSKEDIMENLKQIPLKPKYIDHKYNKYTYPIQDANTREMIQKLKKRLEASGFYFTGRFADWEYYNMDIAIGASMDLCKKITIDMKC